MPKFCANLSFLFTELPFPQRFAAAAKAGFSGVEYLFPYEWPASRIAAWLAEAGVEQVLFNLPPGNWTAGERGIACHPGREMEFAEGVLLALDYARQLGCRRLHAMAGLRPAGADPKQVHQCYLRNIREAARACAETGVTLMIEPINSSVDMPGYFLDTPAQAFALQREIGEPNVRVQYDIYHAQIMEGNLLHTIQQHLPKIGHMQLADVPGRHEPGSGEINYPFLFERLDALGYTGWIGCEYKPGTTTLDSLAWFAATRNSPPQPG